MNTKVLIFLAVLGNVESDSSARGRGSSCASTCAVSTKFHYKRGSTYRYHYTTQTVTMTTGSSPVILAGNKMRAEVSLEVLSKCEFVLKLHDVRLTELRSESRMSATDGKTSRMFKISLERFPLRFSFQDGSVTKLCPNVRERTWALNIKRGVLSTIQNSMDSLDREQRVNEVDVTGSCITDYEVIGGGKTNTGIRKTKTFSGASCTARVRDQGTGSFFTNPALMLKTSYECKQFVHMYGHMLNATCREVHVFRPFHDQHTDTVTKVDQSFTFVRIRDDFTTHRGSVQKRTGLIFEPIPESPIYGEGVKDSGVVLKQLCKSTKNGIRPYAPKLFSQLVNNIRKTDFVSLRNLYRKVQKESICLDNHVRLKKIFLDGILMAQTSASFKLAAELLIKRDVTGFQAHIWLTSLAFIQNPPQEMIDNVKILLEDTRIRQSAMLPVSTLIHNFCQNTPSCGHNTAVRNIIVNLEKDAGRSCDVSSTRAIKDIEKILLNIRAIGNIGHTDRTATFLRNCFTRRDNPIEVRVTAVEGLRRFPCNLYKHYLVRTLHNAREDSELRVAAFLTAMRFPPNEMVLSKVKSVLKNQAIDHASSFIWSHLTNLKGKSSRLQKGIRLIIGDKDLQKKFSVHKMKFSRTWKKIFTLGNFNRSASLDGHVIWSSKSVIPRAAMVNLTLDMFGHPVSLLELGARVDGINDKFLRSVLCSWFPSVREQRKTMSKKRDIRKQIGGHLYMRLFGNEMAFLGFQGHASSKSSKDLSFVDILRKVSKKNDHLFSQSISVLDHKMTIPTAAGLPLRLTIGGTANVDLKAAVNIDMKKSFGRPRSFLIDGSVQPSGASNLFGSITVDAFTMKTGSKAVSSWYSSTSLKGRIEINRDSILTVDLKMPQNRMDILDIRTRLFAIVGNKERQQNTKTKVTKRCWNPSLTNITGIQLCKASGFGVPIVLQLIKKDSHSSFILMADRTKEKTSKGFHLSVDTPGSRADRRIAIDVNTDYSRNKLHVDFVVPWKKTTFKADLVDSKVEKSATMTISQNGKETYFFRTGYVLQNSFRENITSVINVTPTLVFRSQKETLISLTGFANNQKSDGMVKFDFSLAMNRLMDKPVTVKGHFSSEMEYEANVEREKYTANINMKSSVLKFKLHSMHALGGTKDMRGFVRMTSAFRLARNGGTVTARTAYDITSTFAKIGFMSKLVSRTQPKSNFFLEAEGEINPSYTHVKGVIDLRQGKALKEKDRMFLVSLIVKRTKPLNHLYIFKVKVPSKGTDTIFRLHYKRDNESVSATGSAMLTADKVPHLNFNVDKRNNGNMTFIFSVLFTEHKKLHLQMNVKRKGYLKSLGKCHLQWGKNLLRFDSNMTQTSKKGYRHTFSATLNKRHGRMVTLCRHTKHDQYQFNSTIYSPFLKPLHAEGIITANDGGLLVAGKLKGQQDLSVPILQKECFRNTNQLVDFIFSANANETFVHSFVRAGWKGNRPYCVLSVDTVLKGATRRYSSVGSIQIKAVHPYRTVKLYGSHLNTKSRVKYRFNVLWDEAADQGIKYYYSWGTRQGSTFFSEYIHMITTPLRVIIVDGEYYSRHNLVKDSIAVRPDFRRDDLLQFFTNGTILIRESDVKCGFGVGIPGDLEPKGVNIFLTENRRKLQAAVFYDGSKSEHLLVSISLENSTAGRNGTHYEMGIGAENPSLRFDAKMTFGLKITPSLFTVDVKARYLNSKTDRKNISLQVQIDNTLQITTKILTPVTDLRLRGNIVRSNPNHLVLESKVGTKTSAVDIILDMAKGTVEIFRNPRGIPFSPLNIDIDILKDNIFHAEIYTGNKHRRAKRAEHTAINLHMKRPYILQTQIKWRPGIIQELQELTEDMLEQYGNSVNYTLREVSEFISREVSARSNTVKDLVMKKTKTLFAYYGKVLWDVERDLQKIHRNMWIAYRRNEFYIQDLGEATRFSFNATMGWYKNFIEEYRDKAVFLNQSMSDWLHGMESSPIWGRYNNLAFQVKREIVEYFNKWKKNVMSVFDISKSKIKKWLEKGRSRCPFLQRSKFPVFDPKRGEIRNDLDLAKVIPRTILDMIPEFVNNAILARTLISDVCPD